jgi:hypothetical protein
MLHAAMYYYSCNLNLLINRRCIYYRFSIQLKRGPWAGPRAPNLRSLCTNYQFSTAPAVL